MILSNWMYCMSAHLLPLQDAAWRTFKNHIQLRGMHGWRDLYFSSAGVNAVFYQLLQWVEHQFVGVIVWGAPVVLVPIYGFYNRDMAQLSITLDRCNQVQGLYGLWLKISSICWLYSFLHRCLLKKCEPLILAVASYLISVLSIKVGLY